MMPLVSISIPLYFVFSKINLLDTYLGLILIHSCINLPLAVLLMKSFYDDIPKEIDENAFIDGASKFLILHKLIIPLSLGGLSVTFILSFIFSWTEFICAVMLSQMEIKTLPVYASLYKTLPSWDAMSVIISISLLPLFILLLSVQKNIVRGLTLGSIKE
jgi:multiple sugar transport system permease protein